MGSLRAESDCSKATTENPIAGCDLHAQVMGGPNSKVEAVAAPAATPATQKIIVQIELTQAAAPKEPDHIKVHHNPFSVVGRAISHFSKQYALGVKDSIEPRNLGRMTLPVGIGVGTQLVIANQLKQGIKGGFNQVGDGLNKLGQGEAQLGAGQLQLAQQVAGLQQEITVLQGASGASKIAGGLGKSTSMMRESTASFAPKFSSRVSPESIMTAPLSGGAAPVAAGGTEVTAVATIGNGAIGSGGNVLVADGGKAVQVVTVSGDQVANATGAATAATEKATPVDFNVGVDSKGFSVPMTPKQLEKARDYQEKYQTSETQVMNASNDFDKKFADIATSMATDKGSAAFLNDLKMRYQYAMNYDRLGDHNSARAYLSDCKQDVDNLKRMAKGDRNEDAIPQIDQLKQTVNALDDIEKHFKKRPAVVLSNPEQMSVT